MEKKSLLKIDTIFEYYDNPQLLTARDCFDTLYLCLLYQDEPECCYSAIKISSERLQEFCDGKVDLRWLFLHPEGDKVYYTVRYREHSYLLDSERNLSISDDSLPEEGYYCDAQARESYMVNIPVKDHGLFQDIVKKFGWACM